MSGGFPLCAGLCNSFTAGFALGTPFGTQILSGSYAYGSYVELIHSTPSDASWAVISIVSQFYSTQQGVFKYAIGASGSEKDVILDLFSGNSGSSHSYTQYSFPLSVPAGTRISCAACSNAGGVDPLYTYMELFDTDYPIQETAGVDSMGVTLSNTHGSVITGAGSANTKSAWSQVTASTARDYAGLFYAVTAAADGTTVTAANFAIDIGVGAAGSEKIVIPDGWGSLLSAGSFPIWPYVYYTPIPAGTAISARAADTVSGENVGIIVYGVYQ